MATLLTYSGTPANSTRIGEASSNTYQAQQFTATTSGTLTSLKYFERIFDGSPTDGLRFQIWTDSSDSPGSLITGATKDIAHADIVNGGNSWDISESTTVTFATPPNITNASKYWVVIKRQGSVDATNYYNPWATSPSSYAGGIQRSGDATPNWTTLNQDMVLEITITNVVDGSAFLAFM